MQAAWVEGGSCGLFDNISTVLDVGCGTGISSDFFSQKGFRVTGADPSKSLIENNESGQKHSEFVVASAERLPFEDSSFDLVVSFTAIQNFEDIEQGLKEIRRVGKQKWLLTYLKGTRHEQDIRECIRQVFGGLDLSELSTSSKDRIIAVSG